MSNKDCFSKRPEYVKRYYSNWYQRNKAKHLAYLSEKITCDCGTDVTRGNLSKHRLSNKHKLLMSEVNKELKLEDYERIKDEYYKMKCIFNEGETKEPELLDMQ